MRGLKLLIQSLTISVTKSHLLQMRGLKQHSNYTIIPNEVASFTDAWIETTFTIERYAFTVVASFTDAWIETAHFSRLRGLQNVASFTDAWIETKIGKPDEQPNISRIFYRCVD